MRDAFRSPLRLGITAAVAMFAGASGVRGEPARPAPSSAPAETEAWWKGRIEIPGQSLDFVVVFRRAERGDGFRATIDIPAQGAKELPLTDVTFSASEIAFTLAPPANAVFIATPSTDGRTATGKMTQHGMTFPITMERVSAEQAQSVGPARPQTPKPPFPYQQREVTYENPKDQTKLAGTLTLPEGTGPHPAVLLITGSGAQDRDETLLGHKPFFVIADHLTRHGIAVLRVDDRGVGGSTGARPDVTSADFAGDVEAGIAFLKQQPEIDARRIGLAGHSEGAIIAPFVAAQSSDVACIVLLAGSGWPGDKLLIQQNEALLRAAGTPDADIQQHLKAHRAVHQCLREGAAEDKLRAAVRELVQVQLRTATGGKEPDAGQIDQAVKPGVAQFRSPWVLWFLRHDPRESLRQVKCPVLALGGSLDLQVPPKENLPEVEKALRTGGNRDVTVKELPGLNHLFQEARTGLVAEYGALEQTMSPVALDELTGWLQKQFKLGQ